VVLKQYIYIEVDIIIWVRGLWYLMSLSTIFQLYSKLLSVLLVEKTTDLPQVTDKLYQIMFIYFFYYYIE